MIILNLCVQDKRLEPNLKMKNLNPDSVSDEDVQRVAKAMGINLDDSGSGKTEEELNSESNTGTETGEGNRTG